MPTTVTCTECGWTDNIATDHTTGVPTVLHLQGEDENGPTTSHGLEWPVPGDQVINELDEASGE